MVTSNLASTPRIDDQEVEELVRQFQDRVHSTSQQMQEFKSGFNVEIGKYEFRIGDAVGGSMTYVGGSAREAFEILVSTMHWKLFAGMPWVEYPITNEPRGRTKVVNKTIGVHAKRSLWEFTETEQAMRAARSAAMVHRDLFVHGLDILDQRLDHEDSAKVFAEFKAAHDSMPGQEMEERGLRLDREAYNKVAVLAKEYGRSFSQLAAQCMAYAAQEIQSERNRQQSMQA